MNICNDLHHAALLASGIIRSGGGVQALVDMVRKVN